MEADRPPIIRRHIVKDEKHEHDPTQPKREPDAPQDTPPQPPPQEPGDPEGPGE
jgi:hypothetical protein